jgi:hypothetical protein
MRPPGSVSFDDAARLWVLQRGLLRASVRGQSERLLQLTYGHAELHALSIYEPLLDGALFVGREMIARGPSVRLKAFAPPGDPSHTPTDLDDPRQSILHIREVPDALQIRYRTLSGLPLGSVLFALDFAPGGVWENAEGAIRTLPGQVLRLRDGPGRMRYGRDCIEVAMAEGQGGERRLRDAPTVGEFVRVLIQFETPADEQFEIRTYQENTAKWR